MYIVRYVDETEFKGGAPANSRWNEMPNKEIESIEYILHNMRVFLKNFTSYNHLVEKTNIKGRERITKIYLIGVSGVSHLFIFNLLNNTLEHNVVEYNKEYYNHSITGWKRGVEAKNVEYYSTDIVSD